MADIFDMALRYEPETGSLIWLPRGYAKFDNRFAGTTAGTLKRNGYVQVRLNGKFYLAHRLAWRLYHGDWPEFEIDHINGDPADNRIENLRVCTTAENRRNMPRRKNKTSKYTGVRKTRDKWSVVIDGLYRGFFDDEDAAGAYAATIYAEIGFHPNHGRTERRVS
jgi:hypothetical protein